MKFNLILILLTVNAFSQSSVNGKIVLISSGQMERTFKVKTKNVIFDYVLKNRDTTYIQTNDMKFMTKEGYHVGQKFSELPSLIKQSLTKESGWGYFYSLPSGWSIAFCEGEDCTGKYPNEGSKIKWIFKRKILNTTL